MATVEIKLAKIRPRMCQCILSALFPNSTIETSFPFSIPQLSSVESVAATIIASITAGQNSTTTGYPWTTTTLSSHGLIVETVVPVVPVNSWEASERTYSPFHEDREFWQVSLYG